MVTIGNYGVSFSLNAGDLIDEAKLARNEIATLSRSFRTLESPTEKFARQMDIAERGLTAEAKAAGVLVDYEERLRLKLFGVSEAQQRAAEAQKRHNDLMSEGERVTQRLMTAEERRMHNLTRLRELHSAGAISSQTFNRGLAEQGQGSTAAAIGMGSLVSRLGAVAGAYFSASTASRLLRESITAAAETERAAASYEVLTGSAEKAARIMQGTRDLAARGLSLSVLNQSARTMLSFNVAARDIIPTLERIGNITGGDTERLKMMSLAFAQSSAAGRLMGQDLLQMINAGFNPLQEISRKTGRSLVDLKKDMEGGLISFEMVNDAFRTATESGGLYNGMLTKMSTTTAGSLDRAKNKWEMLKISLGESISPAVRGLADSFSDMSKSLEGSVRDLKGLVDLGESATKAISELTGSINVLKHAANLADMSSISGMLRRLGLNATDELGTMMGSAKKREEAMLRQRDRMTPGLYSMMSPLGAEGARAAKLNAELDKANKLRQERLEKEDQLAAKEESRMKSQGSATTQAATEQAKAEEAVNKRYQDRVETLKASIAELEQGKVAAAGLRAEFDGMSAIQQREIMFLARKAEMLKGQAAMEKDRLRSEKEQATLREKLTRDADQIRQKFYTPVEKLAKSLAEIEKLRQLEILTPFEAARASREAAKDSMKDVKFEQPKVATVGSDEAYKLITGMQNDRVSRQIKLAEEQKALAQAAVAAQQETNRRLAALAEVSPRKVRG